MIRAAFLDIDGTLLDSVDAHAGAWVQALKNFGIAKDFADVRKLIGMGADHLLTNLLPVSRDDQIVRDVAKRRGEIFRTEYLSKLKPFRGARELVEKIISENIAVIAATSSSKEDLEGLLRQTGIEDLIGVTVTADDVDRSKPDPDIVNEALKKAKVSVLQAIMIGDTPYDIRAARRVGVDTLAFTCGGWSQNELPGALAVYEGPWDLLSRFDESVFGRDQEISPAP